MSFFWEYLGARATIWGIGVLGSLFAFLAIAMIVWFVIVGAAFVALIWYTSLVVIWQLDRRKSPTQDLRLGSYADPRFLEVRFAGTRDLDTCAVLIFVARFGMLIGAAGLALAEPSWAAGIAMLGLVPAFSLREPSSVDYDPRDMAQSLARKDTRLQKTIRKERERDARRQSWL